MGTRRTARRRPRSVQLTALARIRAIDVLPVPRGPDEQEAVAPGGPVRTALRSVSTTAVLADDLGEGLGPPAAVDGLVGTAVGWAIGSDACGPEVGAGLAGAERIAVHPPSTTDARVPTEEIGSDQAVPRHPASSA